MPTHKLAKRAARVKLFERIENASAPIAARSVMSKGRRVELNEIVARGNLASPFN
jgi:hypothetical protein